MNHMPHSTHARPRLLSARVTGTLLLGAALLAGGCSKQDAPAAQAKKVEDLAVPVVLRSAKTESVQRNVEVVGTLFGDEDTTISNKVPGKVIAIFHDVGDRVKPGEPLAQLLRQDYQLAVNQKQRALQEMLIKLETDKVPAADFDVSNLPAVRKARLEMANAAAKYARGKSLHDQQPPLLSDQDFADLATARDVAKSAYDVELQTERTLVGEARTRDADVAVAQQALDDTQVRTPRPASVYDAQQTPDLYMKKDHTYLVAGRMASVGELKNTITAMFRLVDDDVVKLKANVPERYVPEIHEIGQEADVFIEAYGNKAFEGKVARINPQVDPQNRTFQVEVEVPNSKHLLPPGAFARALVKTHVDERVIFVPQEAVVSFAGVNKVFTVKDGKAVEIGVDLGDRRGEWVEITAGLTGTELVAVKGTSKLATGVPVSVEQPAGPTTRAVADAAGTQ
ncbi:MAG: family efflux transporter, subunit [Phycisphaerales bacterium]|nr:family efflux transporter, subunit [Phycisphaerales bacterium]